LKQNFKVNFTPSNNFFYEPTSIALGNVLELNVQKNNLNVTLAAQKRIEGTFIANISTSRTSTSQGSGLEGKI